MVKLADIQALAAQAENIFSNFRYVIIPPTSELSVFSLTEKGKFSHIGFGVWSENANTSIGDARLRMYRDGALKLNISIYEVDWLTGGACYQYNYERGLVAATVYGNTGVSMDGCLTWFRTCTPNANIPNMAFGFFAIPSEFSTSLEIRFYNPTPVNMDVSATLLYGTYL